MALLRDGGLGEGGVTGVDTSRAMLEKFEKKGEGQGVTTVATEARKSCMVLYCRCVV